MRNEPRRRKRWPAKRFEEALFSLTSTDQTRIIELQGSKRAIPERAKRVRANEHEILLVCESEFEPSSGNAKTEGSSKGFWYPEEFD